MNKILKRNIDNNKIRLLLNKKDVILDIKDPLFKKLPSNKLIRIRKNEYKYLPQINRYFTHFNLQKSNHKIGQIYLLPKIIKSGYFNEKEEILPLLDFNNIYYAECIDVNECLQYNDLKKSDFKFSMSHIKNTDELKKTILKRYTKSMPKLSKNEILDLGVSKTTLKIIGKI